MRSLAAISGKIETKNGECFVGNQRVDCPKSNKAVTVQGDTLDLLPQISSLDKRGDILFSTIIGVVILTFTLLAIFRIRIFGKTLGEYIVPIWYFILVSLAVVAWQYLFGLKIENPSFPLQVSQWVWEAMVLASAYKLSRIPDFSYGNMFFLGVLYSLIIHGTKISVRYFFYGKNLLYCLDRFVYGSLLVMIFAFVLGCVFVYLKRKSTTS